MSSRLEPRPAGKCRHRNFANLRNFPRSRHLVQAPAATDMPAATANPSSPILPVRRSAGRQSDRTLHLQGCARPALHARHEQRKSFPTQHWHDGRWVNGWPQTVSRTDCRSCWGAPAGRFRMRREKDTDNVAALGLIATTNQAGQSLAARAGAVVQRQAAALRLEDNESPAGCTRPRSPPPCATSYPPLCR